jgi:hypothetical protein
MRGAQLRDLLGAEDSTEVADEDEHDRPQLPEAHGTSLWVQD